MKTLSQTLERNLYGIAAVAFLLAATVPNVLVGSVSAAQITERSIQMSNSGTGATSVTYQIQFDPESATDVEAIVVDFCDLNTGPLIGESCTAVGGMTVGTTVDSENTSDDWSAATINAGRSLLLTADGETAISLPATTTFTVSGFTNPDDVDSTEAGDQVGTFYARILTYNDATDAAAYTDTSPGSNVDEGGIALSTTEDISISAAVLETLTFCVSADAPGPGCGSSGQAVTTPALVLGSGTPAALSASNVDTDSSYFQISTNAGSGATVRMAGNTLQSGTDSITAAGDTATDIVAGTEMFGLRLGTPADVSSGTLGIGSVVRETPYSHASNYGFDTTATTSAYGDIIATTDTDPLLDWNVEMIFAATISAATPPGLYTTDLSLIATSVY